MLNYEPATADRFDEARLGAAAAQLETWVGEEVFAAAVAVVGSSDGAALLAAFGDRPDSATDAIVDDGSIFLIASPTKCVTALAVMRLVELGTIRLADPAVRFLPEFNRFGKDAILVEHLLTHTSGLPDHVPADLALRTAEAPLDAFYQEVCEVTPMFRPGTNVSYQSTGSLVLSEIVKRVTSITLADLLEEIIFAPLDMNDSALGLPRAWEEGKDGHRRCDRIVPIPANGTYVQYARVWNSKYWRKLGAPWGGLLSSGQDLAKLCQHLLRVHHGEHGVVHPRTLRLMTTNYLARMPDVPDIHRRAFPWGLGWQLQWQSHAMSFGDLVSREAFGHWGSTGTVIWMDPIEDIFVVLLTTRPLGDPPLAWERGFWSQFANMVCSATAGPGRRRQK